MQAVATLDMPYRARIAAQSGRRTKMGSNDGSTKAPSEPPDLLQCPRCERQVAPIDDDGDLLCGRCRLVLYAG